MKKSQFKTRLKRAVAWDQVPQLTDEDIDELVELARTRDHRGYSAVEGVEEWESATHYDVGQMVVNARGETFSCVVDGVSGNTAPSRTSLNDGTIEWVYQGQTNWTPTYDLNRAAYEGWSLKAAKAASMISYTSDGARYDRDQYIRNCEAMQRRYAITSSAKMRGSVRVYPMILEVRVDGND